MNIFSRLLKRDKQDVLDEIHKEIRPIPPCGEDNFYQHYYWKEEGWGCPQCMGNARRKKELAEEQRKAEVYAKAIADEFERRGLICQRKTH